MKNLKSTNQAMKYCGSSHTHSFRMTDLSINMKEEIKENPKKIRRSGVFDLLTQNEKIDYIVYTTNDPDESSMEYAKQMEKNIALAISSIG